MTLVPTDLSLAAAIPIDPEAILRALNINPRDPKAQAMVLVCERYGLDPVLKHVVLISGNIYVTRDGLLHVAHQTGRLNGIRIESETETDTEWHATVTVYVKGQDHGYTYRGRYPKNGQQKKYGPEMAVKCAEVMALRRAFGVTGIPTLEEQWDKSDVVAGGGAPEVARTLPLPTSSGGGDPVPSPTAPGPSSGEPAEPPADPIPAVEATAAGGGDADAAPAGTVSLTEARDLLARIPGMGEGRALKLARDIGRTEIGAQTLPAAFDELDRHPDILARLCQRLDEMAGPLTAAPWSDKEQAWMHATWADHGGSDARKAAISRITSGRTDSSKELYVAEKRELMTLTEGLGA